VIASWEVGGTLAGIAVPQQVVTLGVVTIGPDSLPELQWVSETEMPQIGTVESTSALLARQFPPRWEVKSNTVAVAVVVADSPDEAQRIGRRKIEDLCLILAIGTSSGFYRFELRAVRQVGEAIDATPFSATMTFSLHEGREMNAAKSECAEMLLRVTEHDDTAGRAIDHLWTAWSLSQLSTSGPVQKAELLALFQAMEVVSSAVAAAWRVANRDTIENKNGATISKLREELLLQDQSDSQREATAVRKCCLELRENAEEFMSSQIEVAGKQLGVPDDSVQIARRLCKVRNQELGHPGELTKEGRTFLDVGDGADGICPAEIAARAYFVHYCLSLGDS